MKRTIINLSHYQFTSKEEFVLAKEGHFHLRALSPTCSLVYTSFHKIIPKEHVVNFREYFSESCHWKYTSQGMKDKNWKIWKDKNNATTVLNTKDYKNKIHDLPRSLYGLPKIHQLYRFIPNMSLVNCNHMSVFWFPNILAISLKSWNSHSPAQRRSCHLRCYLTTHESSGSSRTNQLISSDW